MDNSTRLMINSLAEDILSVYDISVPVQDIDEVVRQLGGTIQNEISFSEGTVEKDGESCIIIE